MVMAYILTNWDSSFKNTSVITAKLNINVDTYVENYLRLMDDT